ncbi:hypothetical protein K9N68_14890 [Kovacikia minuta CCNUW1]|uniref:hypothetical protein n=1 Tax=Kovacikia minuta TaxID=2931930 RepID=UPI001CC98654|nr:hypothetical protein [Kovacikia minuta]UBF29004.1 hypothetical protein K9N68_14890 [Kovacikia minuta CCNUW1]
MTRFPDDDKKLIQFMRQHRPQPPSALPGLEDRILAAVEQPDQPQRSRPRRWYRSTWIPPAIAAGLLVSVVSYHTLTPPKPNSTYIASLETFVETSWQGTVTDSSDDDQFPLNDVAAN